MKRNIMIIMLFAMIAAFAFGVTASIEISTISPTEDITVSEGQFTSVSAEVTCRDIDCGDVNTSLIMYRNNDAFIVILDDDGEFGTGNSVIQTSDGGYAIVGSSGLINGLDWDILVLKFNTSGHLEWARITPGTSATAKTGTAARLDRGASISQASDGGYAITGSMKSYGETDEDFYVLKLSSTGGRQWLRLIDSASNDNNYNDRATKIITTSDGGYAITGIFRSFGGYDSDIGMIKFSSAGSLEWGRTLDGTGQDYGYDIIQTSDGGYAITGFTQSYGESDSDIILIKLSSTGGRQWVRVLNSDYYDNGKAVIQTSDGGYAVAGSYNNNNDIILLKFSSSGSLQWTKKLDGTGPNYVNSLIQTSDGGYAITGETQGFGTSSRNLYLLKLNSAGWGEWMKILNGTGRGGSLLQTTQGNYVIAGDSRFYGGSDYDVLLLKTDPDGNIPDFSGWFNVEANTTSISLTTSTFTPATSPETIKYSTIYPSVSLIELDSIYMAEPYSWIPLSNISSNVPFYTNSSNPSIDYLFRDDSIIVMYDVNASGDIGESNTFRFSSINDINNSIINQTNDFKLTIGEYIPLPVYVSFENDSDTTNFSEVPPNAVHYPVLANDYAKVVWIASNLNLAGLNLDEAVEYAHNRITVRSDLLPVLNTTANLTFRGVSYSSLDAFNVLKDGVVCEDCTKHSASPVVVEVTGFSNYTTQGTGEIPEFGTLTLIGGLVAVLVGIVALRRNRK